MNTRQLKWVSVLLPLLFMVGVIYIRVRFVPPERSLEGNLYAILAVALGATIFSILFFSVIEGREEELRQRSKQVEALHEAALALTTELDLQAVLQKMVDISRELLRSKYGALGVIEQGGSNIVQFITSGITPEERARVGAPPEGHGLLGVIIQPGGQALIISDIRKDPRSVGFPPNHPPMKSLLGVPLKSKGEIFGNLYVADKLGSEEGEDEILVNFDQEDCQLLEKFATQAAIAVENAQLYRKTQELAVIQERERFGMALHDGIMQSVYATGLSLQEAQRKVEGQPRDAEKRIEQSIENLSQVLRDLRNYIMGLRTGRFQGQDLVTSLSQLARELRANTLMNVSFSAPAKTSVLSLSEAQTDELMLIAQEAMINVRKYAQARNVQFTLKRENNHVDLAIDDDGVGFNTEHAAGGQGNGLRNMRERAQTLGANIRIWSQLGKGTHIQVSVPIAGEKDVNVSV
jgi:signal transduction histidine kinase